MELAPVQQFLFQRIREILPPERSLVSAISDALHVSEDSSYRRIRGETPLVLDEAGELCKIFGLSLDQLLTINSKSTLFNTIRIHHQHYSFETFLQDIIQRLGSLGQEEGFHLYYLTKDIPLFHHFVFRPLMAFRYFFWMKSILHHPDFVNKKLDLNFIPEKVEALGGEIVDLYNKIPSTEIWNTESINSTILQIEFYREVGFISNNKEAVRIYQSLLNLINHLESQAECGKKFRPGENSNNKPENFAFFNNRLTLGDNTIFVNTPSEMQTYFNFEVVNYMVTTDKSFCMTTHNALQNLMKKSTLISGVSEKQRNIFFNILRKKVEERIK